MPPLHFSQDWRQRRFRTRASRFVGAFRGSSAVPCRVVADSLPAAERGDAITELIEHDTDRATMSSGRFGNGDSLSRIPGRSMSIK